MEKDELFQKIEKALKELKQIEEMFKYTENCNSYIDNIIHEINGARTRYIDLLKIAKQLELSLSENELYEKIIIDCNQNPYK
ncbi:MAG TPA: hypothetical protein GXZ31_03630 [Thermoanaerobacterales bacterium]|nr:hypothetical protein [Thermoanaerobacterales bacterium]